MAPPLPRIVVVVVVAGWEPPRHVGRRENEGAIAAEQTRVVRSLARDASGWLTPPALLATS